MEDPAVATGIIANTTTDNKILYVPIGWEGWSFIAACSKPSS